jgi:hypothetical protein
MTTKAELLAQIELKAVRLIVGPHNPKTNGELTEWQVLVVEQTGDQEASPKRHTFTVINEGVVAGPQVDAEGNPIYEQVPVLDGNGDPVLDENGEPTYTDGDQVVIAPEDAEQAWFNSTPPDRPVFREQGVTWLKANLPAAYVRFEVERVDEADTYLIVKALKVIDGTTATEVRVIAWRDGGAPQWREIV